MHAELRILPRAPQPQAHRPADAPSRHRGTVPKRCRRTTVGDPFTALPDLVQRDFAPTHTDEPWVGDITYVRTWEGWLSLSTIIAAFRAA